MKRFINPMLVFCIVTILYSIIIYFVIKDSTQCDEHVILTDGTEMDCVDVYNSDSGISTIKLCNGTRIKIPTARIKVITEIVQP